VFIIGNLREVRRPEILPFEFNSKVDTKENTIKRAEESWVSTIDSRYGQRWSQETYVKSSQGDRVHSTEGISPTVPTATGGRHTPMIAERFPLKFIERNQKSITGDWAFTVDSANTGGIKINSVIRRLTPLECERLQGFPDNWTQGFSDTQRYKMMGNAVTVNVIEAIARKIIGGLQ